MSASSASTVPANHRDDLITTRIHDDLLLYNEHTRQLHHLNRECARVWHLCDGQRTIGDIAQLASCSIETTILAVEQLTSAGVLMGTPHPLALVHSRQSRRQLLQRAGVAAAIPAIVSTTVPMAAAATSPQTCEVYVFDEPLCFILSDQQSAWCWVPFSSDLFEETCNILSLGCNTGGACYKWSTTSE